MQAIGTFWFTVKRSLEIGMIQIDSISENVLFLVIFRAYALITIVGIY